MATSQPALRSGSPTFALTASASRGSLGILIFAPAAAASRDKMAVVIQLVQVFRTNKYVGEPACVITEQPYFIPYC